MSEPVYKRSEQALVADVGDDVVALNVERGLTFGMTGVTAAVWNLLSEPRGLTQICDELVRLYEVDAETCRAQVAKLLDEMTAEGLLDQASSSAPDDGA